MNESHDADRAALTRYAIVFAWTAPSAAVVYFVFHAIYQNLSAAAVAIGQVDASTQLELDMAWIVMAAGSAVFGAIAVYAAFRALGALIRLRRAP